MRVMSWNLWWRFDSRHQVTVSPPPLGADHWQMRERGIVATLQAVQPDIAGFQEVWATADGTQADRLAERLGMNAAFGAPSLPPPPPPPHEPDHAGVLTDVMVDSWVAAGGPADGGHTLSSRNPLAPREAWQLDQRIDYVLVRSGTPKHAIAIEQAFVAGEAQDGVHASDHYAVVADVRL
jgi:endonuclease/exonuclease/phosphatase family metal-dependent hydrolase